jgi:hypothetical protein
MALFASNRDSLPRGHVQMRSIYGIATYIGKPLSFRALIAVRLGNVGEDSRSAGCATGVPDCTGGEALATVHVVKGARRQGALTVSYSSDSYAATDGWSLSGMLSWFPDGFVMPWIAAAAVVVSVISGFVYSILSPPFWFWRLVAAS